MIGRYAVLEQTTICQKRAEQCGSGVDGAQGVMGGINPTSEVKSRSGVCFLNIIDIIVNESPYVSPPWVGN